MGVSTFDLIPTTFDTLWQRSYTVDAPDMRRLYENAKRDQWNAARDIDWDAAGRPRARDFRRRVDRRSRQRVLGSPRPGSARRLNVEFSCWRLSQLLHGEEGAMLACSQLVDMVPGNDAKFFQATQVVDEARHTEVLSRYLMDKCGGRIYPLTPNVKSLFDYILGSGKWFIKTVGLQLIAETFAVALFRMQAETAQDPLLKEICRRILIDESRHMGFSVLSLPDEIRRSQRRATARVEDFTHEALVLVLTGQFPREAYEAVGMDAREIDGVKRVRKEIASSAEYALFRKLFKREMHTTIVGNLRKVGLLNPRISGFLRELGIDPTLGQLA